MLYSNDGGLTGALKDLIGTQPVPDQTPRFAMQGGILCGSVLWRTGSTTPLSQD